MAPSTARSERKPDGSIRADEMYTLDAIKSRANLGKAALRQARRQGLPVKRIGRNAYILGADLIRHLSEHGK